MSNLQMYCLTLNSDHLTLIKSLNFIPVGLGNGNFNQNWETDKNTNSKLISNKNQYYGEYTFHYKLWKNDILPKNKWIGFCQYRKFWTKKEILRNDLTYNQFKSNLISEISLKSKKYDVILGYELYVNKFKLSKFIKKKGLKFFLLDPSILFDKKKRSIKFHFDLMHGEGNLDKAISVLDYENKSDFSYFVNTEVSFNPHNMFICKNKKILNQYYNSLFPWLKKCEKIFGFKNLLGYGKKRIYGFLAERYLSYWFKKNSKYYLMPIYFKDISDFM